MFVFKLLKHSTSAARGVANVVAAAVVLAERGLAHLDAASDSIAQAARKEGYAAADRASDKAFAAYVKQQVNAESAHEAIELALAKARDNFFDVCDASADLKAELDHEYL